MNNILRQWTTKRLLEGNKPFRVLILVGQKRSGNHVFLNWYMSQHPGTSLLCNNVRPDQNPLDRHRQELRIKPGKVPPVLIFSYEDRRPELVLKSDPLRKFMARHAGQIEDSNLCVILRDPHNLIASRMQKWPEEFDDPNRLSRIRDDYLHNSALVLSPPDNLLGLRFVPVLYNALITSPPYRAKLTARLGIPDGVKGLDEVPNYGHGSSFDGQDKSGRAAEMAVFARWHIFADDPRFLAVFEDAAMKKTVSDFETAVNKAPAPAAH